MDIVFDNGHFYPCINTTLKSEIDDSSKSFFRQGLLKKILGIVTIFIPSQYVEATNGFVPSCPAPGPQSFLRGMDPFCMCPNLGTA